MVLMLQFALIALLLLALILPLLSQQPIGAARMAGAGPIAGQNPCVEETVNDAGEVITTPVQGSQGLCSGPAGICMERTCRDGRCVAVWVKDCCGNYECEEKETPSNCPADCGPDVIRPEISTLDPLRRIPDSDECDCDECAPGNGVIDGAICICTENDCTDDRDNDGDGLIDCDDPDCVCLEVPCDACEDTYPKCDGVCPDGSECELNREMQRCECVGEEYSCYDADYPSCQGGCPPGYHCEAYEGGAIGATTAMLDVQQGPGCTCVPNDEEVECEDSYAMQCTGTCPPGEVCQYTGTQVNFAAAAVPGTGCECVPETEPECGQSEYPACGGSCPPGEECVGVVPQTAVAAVAPYCMCQPVEMGCEDSVYPDCGGSCPDGLECMGSPNRVCYCGQPDVRCEASAPFCGGYCPEGQSCTQIVTGQCGCTPDNEQNCDDEKDNDGDGMIDCEDPDCEDDPDCQEEPACADSYDMQCTGACDSGLRCAMTSSTDCECIPADTPSCSFMDTAYCEMGSCPSGESCQYTAGECSCVPESVDCEDSWDMQCTGECPEGEYCMMTPTGGGCQCYATYESDCQDDVDNDNDGDIDCRDSDCFKEPYC